MRTLRRLLFPTLGLLAGAGCAAFDGPGASRSDGQLFVILPAQPRDDIFGGADPAPVSVATLEPTVVGWHSAARWDDLEQVIRRSAARRESTVVSLWRGEVLKSAEQQRHHACWYLVVLIGSPIRPADNAGPSATVCSLEFAVPAAFLTAVEDALETFEQENGPNRPIPIAQRRPGSPHASRPTTNRRPAPTPVD